MQCTQAISDWYMACLFCTLIAVLKYTRYCKKSTLSCITGKLDCVHIWNSRCLPGLPIPSYVTFVYSEPHFTHYLVLTHRESLSLGKCVFTIIFQRVAGVLFFDMGTITRQQICIVAAQLATIMKIIHTTFQTLQCTCICLRGDYLQVEKM